MEVAFSTTGSEAAKILQSGSKLLPTPSRTAMAISILANFGSSFTYGIEQSDQAVQHIVARCESLAT